MADRIENQTTQEGGIILCQDTLESASHERDLVDIFFDYLKAGSRSLHATESDPYFGTHGANILPNSLPTGTGKTHVTTHGSARFLGFLSTLYSQKARVKRSTSGGATFKKKVNGGIIEVPAPPEIDLYENRSVLFVSKTKNIFTPCHKIYGEILHGQNKAKKAVNYELSGEDLGVPVLQLFSSNDFRGGTLLCNTSLVGCAEYAAGNPKEDCQAGKTKEDCQFLKELTLKDAIERLLSQYYVDFIVSHIEGGGEGSKSGEKGGETLLALSCKKNFIRSKNEGLREYYQRRLCVYAASLKDRRTKTSEEEEGFFKPPQNEIMMLCTYIAIAAEQSNGDAKAFLPMLKNFGQKNVQQFMQNGRYVHNVGAEGKSDRISLIIKPELYLSLTDFISKNYNANLDREQKLSRLFVALMQADDKSLYQINPLNTLLGVPKTEAKALTICVYAASLLRLISPLTVALSQPSYIAATNRKIIYPSEFPLVGLVKAEGKNDVIMSKKTVKEDLLQIFGGYARKEDKNTSHSAKTLMGRAAYYHRSAMHFQVTNVKRAQRDTVRAREALQGALSHGAEQRKDVAFVRECLPGLILLYDESDTGLTESSNVDEKGWASQTTQDPIISKINIVDNHRLIFNSEFIEGFRDERDITLKNASNGSQDQDTDGDEVEENERHYRPRDLTGYMYDLGVDYYHQLYRKTRHFPIDLISIYDGLCKIYEGKDAHSCARAMRLITVGDKGENKEENPEIRQSFSSVLFDFMAQSEADKKTAHPSPQMASCGSTLRFFENQKRTEHGQKPLINPEVFIFVDTVCGEPRSSGLCDKLNEAKEDPKGVRFRPLTEHVFSLTAVVMLFLIAVGTFRNKILKERVRNHGEDEGGVSLSAAIYRELSKEDDTQYGMYQLAKSLMSLQTTAEENAHLLGFIDAFCSAKEKDSTEEEVADCLDMQDCIKKLEILMPDSTLCLTPLDTSGKPNNKTRMELRDDNDPVIQNKHQSYALSIECQPIDYALFLTAFASNRRNLLVPMSATQNDDTIPYSLFSSRVYQNYAEFVFNEVVSHQPTLPHALQVIRTELAHAFLKTIEKHNACMGTFHVSLPCEAGFQPPSMEERGSDSDYMEDYSRFIAELLFNKREEEEQQGTKHGSKKPKPSSFDIMQRAAMASLAGCFLSAQTNALIVCRSSKAIKSAMGTLGRMANTRGEKPEKSLKTILDEHKVLAFYCPDDLLFQQGYGYILAQRKGIPSNFTFSLPQNEIAEQVADILAWDSTADDRVEHTSVLREHLIRQMTQMKKRCLFVLEIRNDQPCLTTLYFRPRAEDIKGTSLEKDYDIMRQKVCKYERAIVVACYEAIGVGFNGQISYAPYAQKGKTYECDLTSIGFASLPYYNDFFSDKGQFANIQNADKIRNKARYFYNHEPRDQRDADDVFVNQSLRVIFQAAGRTTRKHTKSDDLPDEPGYPLSKECYGHLHNVCAKYFSYRSKIIQVGGSKGRGCVLLAPFFNSGDNKAMPAFFLNQIYDKPITDAALRALNHIDDQKQKVIEAQQDMPEEPNSLWFGCAGSSTSALITALKEAGHSYQSLLKALDDDEMDKLEEALDRINAGLKLSNEAFQKIFNHGGYDASGYASKSYMQRYRDRYAAISEDKDSDLDTLKRQAQDVEHFARMNAAMRKIGVSALEAGALYDDQVYLRTLLQVCHSLEENDVPNKEVIISGYMAALFRGRVIFPDQVPQADSIFTREPESEHEAPLAAYGAEITATMNRIWSSYDKAMMTASAPYRIVFRVFMEKGEEENKAHEKTLQFLHLKVGQVYDPNTKDRVFLRLERKRNGIATVPAFALEIDPDNSGKIRPRPVNSFLFVDGQGAPSKVIIERNKESSAQSYALGRVCDTTYVRSSASRTACGRAAYQPTPPRQEGVLPPDNLLALERELVEEENLPDEAIIAIPFGNLVSTIKGNVGEAIMQKTLGDMLPYNEGWTPHLIHADPCTQRTPDQSRRNLMLNAVRNAVYEKADYIFFAASQKRAVSHPTNIFLDVKNMNSLQFFGEGDSLARYAEKAYDLHKAAMRYQHIAASLAPQDWRSGVTIRSVYIIAQVVRSNQLSESLQSNQSIASALGKAIADHAHSKGDTCAQDIAVAVWTFHEPDYAPDKTTANTLSLKMCSDYKNARKLMEACNNFLGDREPEVTQPVPSSVARAAIPLIQPIPPINPIR